MRVHVNALKTDEAQRSGSILPAVATVPDSMGVEVHGNVLGLPNCAKQQNGSIVVVNESACHFPRLKDTGVGWVRNEFEWIIVEGRKG